MPLPKFILNDQRVKNSHGFYLENAGGRFERFDDNPVMLDNHDMSKLVGRWEELAVEGDLLTATPVFDEGTELGRERKGQVEQGISERSIDRSVHTCRRVPAEPRDERYGTARHGLGDGREFRNALAEQCGGTLTVRLQFGAAAGGGRAAGLLSG